MQWVGCNKWYIHGCMFVFRPLTSSPEIVAFAASSLLASGGDLPLIELTHLLGCRRLVCILVVSDLEETREPQRNASTVDLQIGMISTCTCG